VAIVPLTAETHGLIGAAEMGLMKPGALLVNAARGPVVVTDALVEALQQNRLRAVLDVTDPEPLPAGHPLWSAPNCMITPHVGGQRPSLFIGRFGLERIRCGVLWLEKSWKTWSRTLAIDLPKLTVTLFGGSRTAQMSLMSSSSSSSSS